MALKAQHYKKVLKMDLTLLKKYFLFTIAKSVRLCIFCLFIISLVKIYGNESFKAEKYSNEVSQIFIREAKKQFGLTCNGTGGSIPDKIDHLSFYFQVFKRMDLADARELEINLSELLLKVINEHENIRPYLKEYPAQSGVTSISLSFLKPNGDYYTDGSVASIVRGNGNIHYLRADRYTGSTKDLKNETYEEALKIIKAGPPPGGWPAYTGDGTEFEKADSWSEQLAYLFGEEMAREFKFTKHNISVVFHETLKSAKIFFQLEQVPTYDEAGELVAFLTNQLIERINSHEKLRAYLPEYPFDSKRIECVFALPDCSERQKNKEFAHVLLEKGSILCRKGVYLSTDDNCAHRESLEAASERGKKEGYKSLLKFKRPGWEKNVMHAKKS